MFYERAHQFGSFEKETPKQNSMYKRFIREREANRKSTFRWGAALTPAEEEKERRRTG